MPVAGSWFSTHFHHDPADDKIVEEQPTDREGCVEYSVNNYKFDIIYFVIHNYIIIIF